ncbi:hypothetical protein A2165_00485 [Candidatus Curtissbacteria bacterium RBG_13_40_7]|uniref:YdbS-like PH domain-containing protein n=1 Tax=Candidatus Curtissbacteria bacterium RBG_13_40_7 TaxID=1797706 RepID=A0A1F5FVR6_9BACT|nr:MAG: hypothetical protein A2165_00485 [Candidatus Curtissbacteria bacterium RBG_13_40_7]
MPEDTIHTTHTRNPFAMVAAQPLGINFEAQEHGEKIILLLRAHVVTLIPSVFIIVLLVFMPTLVPSILAFLRIDIGDILASRQQLLIGIFWYLFTFGYAFYKFLFWYFNVYILTNERVVDIDFKGLLHKETSYAKLNQIQDVSPKIIGFFGTFFHYGNVYVQTAAEKPEFEFHNVARPDMVAQEILEQVRKEEGEAPGVIA